MPYKMISKFFLSCSERGSSLLETCLMGWAEISGVFETGEAELGRVETGKGWIVIRHSGTELRDLRYCHCNFRVHSLAQFFFEEAD